MCFLFLNIPEINIQDTSVLLTYCISTHSLPPPLFFPTSPISNNSVSEVDSIKISQWGLAAIISRAGWQMCLLINGALGWQSTLCNIVKPLWRGVSRSVAPSLSLPRRQQLLYQSGELITSKQICWGNPSCTPPPRKHTLSYTHLHILYSQNPLAFSISVAHNYACSRA